MKSRIVITLAALCASITVSAQTQVTRPPAHRRVEHARALRRARLQKQSVMFTRAGGPRAVAPRQSFDNSGNGMLKGAYFVRQVMTLLDLNTSAITQGLSLTGTMTFDGNGNYSFTGQELNSAKSSTAVSYSVSGVYAVSSSGLVQIQTPIDVDSSDTEFGGIGGSGAVVASATEGDYDDIFVAIPEGAASGVTGTYNAGFIDYLQANAGNVRDGYFTMVSNGTGSFGNVTVNGQAANQGGTATTQSLAGVSYTFSGQVGTLTFPTASNPLTALVSGAKTFAVSTDGNILVGGNPNGYDLVVALKAASSVTNATFVNTYFQGALENPVDSCGQTNCMDSFSGSILPNALGAGTEHLRNVGFDFSAFDYTSDLVYNFQSNGVNNDGEFEWLLGAKGEGMLQVGLAGYYTLIVAFQAPSFSGSGAYINPDAILNSANFAPITNSIAPGEYVSMFGTSLGSAANASSLPLPANLGSTSVSVNGTAAPLLATSPTLLSVFTPNETPTYDYAIFQVGGKSNQVTLYTASTAPGVFTSTANAIGPADAFHGNYTAVTSSSPAAVAETVFFYANGLGSTTPAVADGAAAPSASPFATVDDPNLELDLFDSQGNQTLVTNFTAILAPGLAGVYQVNFTIPSGVASGECYLDVGTTDGYTSEAKFYVQ